MRADRNRHYDGMTVSRCFRFALVGLFVTGLLSAPFIFRNDWRLKYSTDRFDHIPPLPTWAKESRDALMAINEVELSDAFWDEVLRRREARDDWPSDGSERLEAIRRAQADFAQSADACDAGFAALQATLGPAGTYPVLYDMVEDEESTILKFQRQRAWADLVGDEARRLALAGQGEEALELLAGHFSHWRRAVEGSWSLVTLMSSVVILKHNLAILDDVIALDPELSAGEGFRLQLHAPFAFRQHLARVLKMEYLWAARALRDYGGDPDGEAGWWAFRVRPTINAVGAVHFAQIASLEAGATPEILAQSRAAVDFGWTAELTNHAGCTFAREKLPSFDKILRTCLALDADREEHLRALSALAENPAPKNSTFLAREPSGNR